MFNRPDAILGALGALIALAVGFGLNISSEQQALILAAVTALFGALSRTRETPPGRHALDEGDGPLAP
jgi:hypothetical protein